jgi:hypothetical protein
LLNDDDKNDDDGLMCVLCDGMYIIERGRQEQDKVGDRNHQLVEAVSLVFSRSQDTGFACWFVG